MTKNEILSCILNNLQDRLSECIEIIEDQIFIKNDLSNYSYELSFRCQKYGSKFVLNSLGVIICVKQIEKDFKMYLHPELLLYYKPKYTILGGIENVRFMDQMKNFIVQKIDDVEKYSEKIIEYVGIIKNTFLDYMSEIKNIGEYINKYSFIKKDLINVSAVFPIQILKMMYFLKMGGFENRYQEYKYGLIELIDQYQNKYPEQREKIELYKESYKYFIDNIEKVKWNKSCRFI